MARNRTTSNAVDILHRRYYDNKPERQEDLAAAHESLYLARAIYDLRKAAGLTQKQLAEQIGTSPSVISRIENEGYEGHSIKTLRKIALALDVPLRVEFGVRHVKEKDRQPA